MAHKQSYYPFAFYIASKEFARLLLWRSHKSKKLVLSVIPEHVQDVLLGGGPAFFKEDG